MERRRGADAGGIIPMTAAGCNFTRLDDEPSRCIRLFPGPGQGGSRFTLIEDDGESRDGPTTEITLELGWTPRDITLRAQAAGGYTLPDEPIIVSLPEGETRRLRLEGSGASLVAGEYQPS